MILELLKKITKLLELKKIPYMLSGSIALNEYTVPRMTMDIDFVVELEQNSLVNFFSIFDDKYYLNKNVVEEETNRKGMFNVIDLETGLKIDFIVKKDTEYRKYEFKRRKITKIYDFNVWIVAPEDLTISKLEWIQQLKSDKQITDIKNLLAIPDIDKKYIENWCEKLNINTFNLL